MLYKGDKGVNVAARPPEGGPTEAQGHTASSLLCRTMPASIKANSKLMLLAVTPEQEVQMEVLFNLFEVPNPTKR